MVLHQSLALSAKPPANLPFKFQYGFTSMKTVHKFLKDVILVLNSNMVLHQ